MHRLGASIVGVGVSMILGACGLGSAVSGPIDPGCLEHAHPVDCDAALEAAMNEIGLDRERYSMSVGTIDCGDGTCTTWVSAAPIGDDDCIPSWDVEVTRPPIGSWSVSMQAHGDPPCAFEP